MRHVSAAAAQKFNSGRDVPDLGLEIRLAPRSALRDEELAFFDAEGWEPPGSAELLDVLDASQLAAPGADGPAGPLAPKPGCSPIPNTFCRYADADPDNDNCLNSIQGDLTALSAHPIAELIDISDPLTEELRHLYALRIGKHDGEDVPQLLLFGAQHAREWASSGLLLHLARSILTRYDDPDPQWNWLRTALANYSVVIAPVANPDGYAYTIATGGIREWRRNRRPCTEEGPTGACNAQNPCPSSQVCSAGQCYRAGVDPNRNFPFAFGTPMLCTDDTYQGDSAGAEAETQMLDRLFLNDGLTGSYVTLFYVNYHSYGNWVLYPDGHQDGLDGGPHFPCVRGDWQNQNCQTPDYSALRWIAGSEAAPVLFEEVTGKPYKTDTIWRNLYSSVGDELSHHSFSHSIRDWDPGGLDRRALGISVELTGTSVSWYAECMPQAQWSTFFNNQWVLFKRIMENGNLETLGDGEALELVPDLGHRTGRRIHRLRNDDDFEPANYGPPRFWIDVRSNEDAAISPPNGFQAGSQASWDIAGRFYHTYWWKPTTPYNFPTHFTVCLGSGSNCEQVDLDGAVNLCSAAMFDQSNGWVWEGETSDDCSWRLTGTGAGPFTLQRVARNIPNADLVHLNYSYRLDYEAFTASGKVEVQVREGAGAWVTVRVYPATAEGGHTSNPDESGGSTVLRTENVDLPDGFDQSNNIRVRFRATGLKSPLPLGWAFRVYDVVLIGRHLN